MSTPNNISYSISLNNVAKNDATRELFLVAERSDDSKELDMVDAVSYFLYLDRFERCSGDDFCEDKISRADMRREQPYTSGDVAQEFLRLSRSKQAEIWNRALSFMGNANDIISRNRMK